MYESQIHETYRALQRTECVREIHRMSIRRNRCNRGTIRTNWTNDYHCGTGVGISARNTLWYLRWPRSLDRQLQVCRAHVVQHSISTTEVHSRYISLVTKFWQSCDMSSIGKYEDQGGIKCIPQTFKKYVSFSLGSLRFLDSFQFLSSSLEKLTENLKCNDSNERFKHFYSEFNDPTVAGLLLRKGVFPYNYVSDESKFDETTLPHKQEFYSELKKRTHKRHRLRARLSSISRS